MLFVLIFFSLAIVVLAVIFAVQNPNVVQVSFLAWETNAPLALALLVAFILGFILGLLILASGLIKRGLLASKLGKRVKELEEALEKKERKEEEEQKKEQEEKTDVSPIS